MNDQQRNIAQAYERAFSSQDATLILDDLTVFVNSLAIEHQPGAFRVLSYVLLKRSALRREKAAGPRAPAKGKV